MKAYPFALLLVGCLVSRAIGADPLIPLRARFDTDPGWRAFHNRVRAKDPPTLEQAFGYQPPGTGLPNSGSIGGTIWCSTTPATYGQAVGPFSFADRLEASGVLRVTAAPGRSAAYLGFFSSRHNGWRPPSALMIQLSGSQRGEARGTKGAAMQVWLSVVSETWQADASVTDELIPADGSPHRWRLVYDPNGRIDTNWPDPALGSLFHAPRSSRQAEAELAAAALAARPDLTRPKLRSLLERAADQGLVIYDPRGGVDYWEQVPQADKYAGSVSVQIDDGPARVLYLAPGHRAEPITLDRFGLVNQQTSGNPCALSVGDLVINGAPVDLTRDPGWVGVGNRVRFSETDFHARQDFGFTRSNHAGGAPGEIGGTFWRTEPVDPLFGYYADEVGALTLDDPISFSGRIVFLDGNPDSAMWLGYFDEDSIKAKLEEPTAGYPLPNTMGLVVDGPTRVGWYLSPFCTPTRDLDRRVDGPLFCPSPSPRRFSFVYDPAHAPAGRVTMTLDDQTQVLDLSPEARTAGARFNRFGLATMRRGGKRVILYFDDLDYTARRAPGYLPARHGDDPVAVDYPAGGRKY